jgi:branched-subunit amino acid transport protein
MSIVALIGSAAFFVYLCRVGGFVVPNIRLTPYWERFFHLLPSGVFAALLVVALTHMPTFESKHGIALLVVGLAMWRTKQIALSVAVGLVVLWVLATLRI